MFKCLSPYSLSLKLPSGVVLLPLSTLDTFTAYN